MNQHEILVLIVLSSNNCSGQPAHLQTCMNVCCTHTQGMHVGDDPDHHLDLLLYWIHPHGCLTLYLIETPLNNFANTTDLESRHILFANRVDPDQAALVRAA